MKYERITLLDRTSFILRIDGETEASITGIEVNAEGDEVRPRGFDNRRRTVSVSAIKSRVELIMDMHYGTLIEPVTQ